MESIAVLQFDLTNFLKSMSNEWISPDTVAKSKIVDYLFKYLSTLRAATMVVEQDYNDADYLDDFATYYVRCFSAYNRRCRRLHFFTSTFDLETIEQILTKSSDRDSQLQQNYLGFVVARPLPEAVVGRTILRTYDSTNRANEARIYSCTKPYSANLFGLTLKLQSLVYQEQDTVVAACASVALWCAFQKTSDLFGTISPKLATITNVGNQVVHPARSFPSHGLNILQICNAIRYVELEPEVVQANSDVPLVSLLYAHLRMGIPVVILLQVEQVGLHAVTVVGYSIGDSPVHARETGPSTANPVAMIGLRITQFYVHDDQIGPFASLRIEPSAIVGTTEFPVTFSGTWKDAKGTELTMYPVAAIIPVYHKIRITWIEIQKWIIRIDGLCRYILPPDTFEWDLHLIPSNDYKHEIRENDIIANDRVSLLKSGHPRFVWRAVLQTINGQKHFEMLADATGIAKSFPLYKIVWVDDELRKALRSLIHHKRLASLVENILTPAMFKFLVDEVG